ncbi:MAG: hypothetical protein AABY16_04045 [Nanoarchaeota archaeon]
MQREIITRTADDLRLEEFATRTGLPFTATLQELKDIGGRYFTSEPIIINGRQTRVEYIFLDPDGTERKTYVWKRTNEADNFIIHMEAETRMKY